MKKPSKKTPLATKKKAIRPRTLTIRFTPEELRHVAMLSDEEKEDLAKKAILGKATKAKKEIQRRKYTESEAAIPRMPTLPQRSGRPTDRKLKIHKLVGRFDSATDAGHIFSALEYTKVKALIANESDRGCLLTAHAVLDDLLGAMLYCFLVERRLGFISPKENELAKGEEEYIRLNFKPDRPLGSFSARVSMCYAIGLINDQIRNTLLEVNTLRNQIAHHPVEFSFEDCDFHGLWFGLPSERTQYCLALLDGIKRFQPEFASKCEQPGKFTSPNREIFEWVTEHIFGMLMRIAYDPSNAKAILEPTDFAGDCRLVGINLVPRTDMPTVQ